MRSLLMVVLSFATLMILACSGLGVDTWQYWAVALLHMAAVLNSAYTKDGDNDG